MSFHKERDNSIVGNLTANSRDGELQSILTFDEEECDMGNLMERGMFITKRTFYKLLTRFIAIYVTIPSV